MPVESMPYKPKVTTLLLRMICGIVLSPIACIRLPYAFLDGKYAPSRTSLPGSHMTSIAALALLNHRDNRSSDDPPRWIFALTSASFA